MTLLLEPMDGTITDPPDGIELDPARAVKIGRAGSSDIKIHDQLVEVHHARMYFDPGREHWIIEDLKSKNGTFVNGECLRDGTRVVRPGTELRFGDARLKVHRSLWRLPWWALAVGAFAGGLVIIAAVLLFAFLQQTSEKEYIEVGRDGIMTPKGRLDRIETDPEFLRARGLSWNLKMRRVSDGDDNGIDELWLDVNNQQELVITFDDEMRWIELGLMPLGGVPSRSAGYPEIDVRSERWRMDPRLNRYRPFEHDAPVVWYREEDAPPPPPPTKAKGKGLLGRNKAPAPAETPPEPLGLKPLKPLKATRLSLRDETLLGQFLSDRGVHVPAHYIICELAFDGIAAQVLTYDGQIFPLDKGCIGELHMEGIAGQPYAIALSPAGWRSLVDDVVTFYTGAPDGLFTDSKVRSFVEEARQDPGFLKTGRVFARPASPVPGHNPIPNVGEEAPGIHPLTPTKLHKAAKTATTVTIPGPDQPYEYPIGAPDSCEVLRVTLSSFEPGGSPFRGNFATIEEVGCGPPRTVLEVGYGAGIYPARVGSHEIRFAVDADAVLATSRILRARLSWR